MRRLFILLALTVWPGPAPAAPPPARKLIATGWDNPTPAVFRAHLSDFEKLPFDGTVITPTRRTAEGAAVPASSIFTREPWQPGEIEAMVADLKDAKPVRAKDNFLAVLANPGDVDWFDDAGWREIVDHWRLLARAARQGGLRGLAFDPEPYTPPHQPFHFLHQAQADKRDFAAYSAKARERGREVMQAVAAEFPEVMVLAYRLYSDLLPVLAAGTDPAELLQTHPYGLLPSFLDGWWDTAPPKLIVVEGNEDAGYRANSDAEFERSYALLRTQAPALVAPENRAKFRSQLFVGHGLYLDAYTNPRGAAWFIDPLGGTPASRLEANATAALRASDGCVWVYGETGRWWPGAGETGAVTAHPPWTEKFPGVEVALARARQPAAAARERLAAAGPADNRLKNADFSKSGAESLPAEWWTWQTDDSRGTARRDDAGGAATAVWAGAAEAAFGQEVTVKPGESYAAGVRVKKSGRGAVAMKVGWKDAKGNWTAPSFNVSFPPEGAPDTEGWRPVAGMVRVPPGAAQMVLMLATAGQPAADDRAWFADARVVKM